MSLHTNETEGNQFTNDVSNCISYLVVRRPSIYNCGFYVDNGVKLCDHYDLKDICQLIGCAFIIQYLFEVHNICQAAGYNFNEQLATNGESSTL